MINDIYQILVEIENENFSQALTLVEKINVETADELSHKLLALGEVYYANPIIENFDKTELETLINNKIKQIDLDKSISTDKVALDYAGLKLANMLVKRDDVQALITELRMYIFANNIDEGTLVTDSQTRAVDSSILRACVPYSLFEPEDLIVVEAYKQLLKTDISECSNQQLVDITLYAIDKRDIYVAARYLNELETRGEAGYGFELAKIKIENVLGDEILHKPYGNNHPYTPQKYERCPREVTNQDQVTISAITKNLDELKLKMLVNGQELAINPAIEIDIIEYAKFTCGPFKATDTVSYYFETKTVKSEVYQLPVSDKLIGLEVDAIEGNCVKFKDVNASFYIVKHGAGYKLSFNNNEVDGVEVKGEGKILVIDDKFKIDLANSSITSGAIDSYMFSFITEPNTKFFGFGERYNNVVQEHATIDNYVFSQYKDQGIKTYIPMPIGFTNKGYAIACNTYNNTKFNVEAEAINVEAEQLTDEIYLLVGTYEEQIQQFHSLTSKPERLADWVYGPWMSSNNWDSQAEVLNQKDKTLELDIPSTVLVIEQWSDEATFYAFNDATYNEKKSGFHTYDDYNFKGRWPNPKAMVEELHSSDLKCFLWQIPVIKYVPNIRHLQKNLDEQYALQNDYVVKHQDGRPYRIAEDWFKDSLVIDFTNEAAKKWWFDKRKYLVDEIGIDGFKTDGGECLFGNDITLNEMADSKKVRNLYPETYISSYYNFLKERGDGFTFSRAGYFNAQSYPAHWAGDERSTFDAFDRTIKAGINAGLSGITYWSWDLAGFNGDIPSSELFIRSTQMATFCPIMQYHAESKGEFNQDRTPWNIAERHNTPEVIDIYRKYAHLRMQLIPYIKTQAEKSLAGGKPLMRAMFLEHNQPAYYDVNDQYYFGDSILVAPIKKEGALAREVIIPENNMLNAFTLEEYQAGVVTVENELSAFPLLLRTNSLIPMNIKTELAKDMENKDFENFKHLKFVYTGGNAEIEYEDIKISITDGVVTANQQVSIIDLKNELNYEGSNFLWNGKKVSEKRI